MQQGDFCGKADSAIQNGYLGTEGNDLLMPFTLWKCLCHSPMPFRDMIATHCLAIGEYSEKHPWNNPCCVLTEYCMDSLYI